ncbi:MAG: serine hydrolase [Candidatus Nealsonbacteria bacterium]|nr:serine hydrolase [Candidatus Nealsonbacteria bacterium]
MIKKLKIPKFKRKEKKIRIILTIVFIITLIITTSHLVKEINRKEDINLNLALANDSRLEFYRSQFPLRNWDVPTPIIGASGFLVASIEPEGKPKILFDKNRTQRLPIASIAKLMTAVIVLEEYNLNEVIAITEEAFLKDHMRTNVLYPGETYKVKDLLYASLIESSNTAAHALAQRATAPYYQPISANLFVNRMNQKAVTLGMNNTRFINPSGLDPANPRDVAGYSTPDDLLILAEYLLKKPKIWEILSIKEFNLKTNEGSFKYIMSNTNGLLDEPGIIGGKTGQTARARGCLFMVSKNPKSEGYLISIILGSQDRFGETRTLLRTAKEAFHWIKI